MQKGKKTTGWLILQLACLGFLVASMGTISNQDSTQLLLMVMVSCPIIATLPALLYIPKHPLVWMYCSTLFNIGVIAFFYYLTCVWQALFATPYGQALPWWVDMWLPAL